ncbi:MAG: hypothetical protein RLO01_12685 [Thalassobaculaceae bacterium]
MWGFEWIRSRLTGTTTVPMREAAGSTVDLEEEGFRRLTGDSKRDLSPLTQKRMQDLAVYLWQTNLIARRLIELPIAYLLAEGVAVTVDDEDAQSWIDAFWRDPINRMDIKLEKKVRELALYGEQFYPAFVNEVNGHVRLGYLDPGMVETIVLDPDNVEQPIGVVTRKDSKGIARRFKVIINGPEDVFTERTQEIRKSFTDGDCFYFQINALSNQARGTSDMLGQMDWLDAYDSALFGELDRWQFMRAFVYDVTLKNATPEEVKQRAKEIKVPSPGSVRVHNEAEDWKTVAPDLGSYESANSARLFRNHIIGGATIPEHWFGGGGDVNRATASEMGEPTFKVFSMRQATIGYILEEICTYVIRQRLRILFGATPEQSNHAEDYRPRAEWPEMTIRDTTAYASALQQVIIGCGVAIDRGLLSEETAVSIIAQVAERLGLEIDPKDELERAQKDAARRREYEDVPDFPDDPADSGSSEGGETGQGGESGTA